MSFPSVLRQQLSGWKAAVVLKQVKCQILEASPFFYSYESNLSCQLSAHRHAHTAEDMLNANGGVELRGICFFQFFPWQQGGEDVQRMLGSNVPLTRIWSFMLQGCPL